MECMGKKSMQTNAIERLKRQLEIFCGRLMLFWLFVRGARSFFLLH